MSLWNGKVPLDIHNNCPDTLWPAIYTSSGGGPGTGGFALAAGANRSMEVATDWYGRVWARTNCTSPAAGDDDDDGVLNCQTGTCGQMDCTLRAGNPPATLAEFNLAGGTGASQNFVDLSLVDGYNVPVGLTYVANPNDDTTISPPANLVSPACIATAGYLSAQNRTGTEFYTNATYPMPYEAGQGNGRVGHWCPWDLQTPLDPDGNKPGAGVYPYPDDDVARPVFDPCLSACQHTGSARDCCTGDKYGTAGNCPRSLYSRRAKAVCPDAYSFPYDDSDSTFVIPAGGGWRVTFCPRGRSTNILATFGGLISEWAATGVLSEDILQAASNVTYIETHGSSAAAVSGGVGRVLAVALVVSGLVMGCGLW